MQARNASKNHSRHTIGSGNFYSFTRVSKKSHTTKNTTKKLTTPEIPRTSPIQVLIGPNVA